MQTDEGVALLFEEVKKIYEKQQRVFDFFITCWEIVGDLTVVIGGSNCICSDLVEAIDVLYKTITVFGKEFPLAAMPVWQFIASVVYSLNIKNLIEVVVRLASTVCRAIQDRSVSRKRKAPDSVVRNFNAKKAKNSNANSKSN